MFLFRLLAFLLLAASAAAQGVSVEQGAVTYTARDGSKRRLSDGPQDEQPVLSPNGRAVVFLRNLPGRSIAAGSGEVPARELWLVPVEGGSAHRLLAPRDDPKPERLLAGLQNPRFSPDGSVVYVESAAWATSGAIHAVEARSGRERFVVAGHSLTVVPSGPYRGCLVVMQHRYFLGGGSFDWYWLFRPEGKEVGPIGEDAGRFLEQEAAGR